MASDPQELSPDTLEIIENDNEDTMMNEAIRQEDEFLEYLMSFPRTDPQSSNSARPVSTATINNESINNYNMESQPKVGLDHLDNLCKLMEQLGELREQNNRLQRRVQYLEDLRALQDMHRQLKTRVQQRQSSEESLLGGGSGNISALENVNNNDDSNKCNNSGENDEVVKDKIKQNLHQTQSFKSIRSRSRSVGLEELPLPPIKAKVSKWTRVKEAFRWEKAQLVPIISAPMPLLLPEAKSQDSGIGLGQDGIRTALLQVPRNVESVSPADSVLSYSAPMSSSSSSEDLMDIDLDFAMLSEVTDFNSGSHRSASAAGDTIGERHPIERGRRRSLSPGPEDEATRRSKSLETGGEDASKQLDKKASKTPWGKVKNIIQTRRDSLKRRGPPRLGAGSDDEADDESAGTRSQRSREPSGDKRTPTLTVTVPSIEELHPPRVKPPQSPHTEDRVLCAPRLTDLQGARPKEVYRRQTSLSRPGTSSGHVQQSGTSPPVHRRPSKWTKVKKAFLTSRREDEAGLTISMPCSPSTTNNTFQFDRTPSTSPTQVEIQKNYEELQSRLSQEFHKKMGEWERRKSNVGPPPLVASSGDEEQLSADFRKKLHEWERIKSGVKEEEIQSPPPPPPMPPPPPVHYHLSPQFRKRLLEWQIRRAVSGKANPSEEHELHRVLPEEFTRKLQQWERIKAGKTSPRLARKDSRGETSKDVSGAPHEKSKIAHKEKQLQWLEKELNKVEREKRRLERDREKFLEREARLERMRRAMKSPESSGEQEVLIQTSTGFFRFQGISEQFTKRLYEWEQQRGIAPEASTFALLDPKYRPEAGEEAVTSSLGGVMPGTLVRSKSVGSVADMTSTPTGNAAELVQSQPSSLSLNDVEALEAELEETRVSSEPRLRTDSHSRPRTDSRSVPRSRSNSRSAPRVRPVTLVPVLLTPPLDECPGAMIVDVEDEIEEALLEIPAVREETPVWSYAPDEITSLSHVTTSERREIGEDRSVKRGDSIRSYQLLEENMQLLGELKEKEAICRQLEAEMEQLERKLQDVAATQNRQLERLRREETDRTDDEEQQAVPAPSEERVMRLRRSVMELGARRQRLQRQGQALQDSFANAWQEQAALAQSLVGRMRLLRRGVTEDGNQPESRDVDQDLQDDVSSAVVVPQEAESRCQDPVARVEVLSQQLLTLAEKLEEALSSRTREIQSLRSELLRGSPSGSSGWRERLRPPSRSDSHLSSSLNSLQTQEVVESLLPRQSSDEVAELPLLLTNKVLELKEGLSDLCAVACKERESALPEGREKPVIDIQPAQEESVADENDAPSATFVIRVGGRSRGPSEVKSSTPLPQVAPQKTGVEASASPVASLTICPAFWKRVPLSENDDPGHRSPDNSFCSALSSSESEREEEEEEEEEEKSYYESDINEPVIEQKLIIRSHTTGSILKQHKDDPAHIEIQKDKEDDDSNKHQRRTSIKRSKLLSEENRDLWRQHQYITTVSTTAISAEAKKLKTRRVSDTHVAYKSQEAKTLSEPSSPINVFVPTQRKIFSPIQGKTENIIGYVVSDSQGNIPEKTNEIQVISPWRRRGSTESENIKQSDNSNVIPWRRTRDSQSASPALPRKILASNFSPESSPRSRRVLLDGKNDAPLPPPFPRSPTPNRRAELKANKETAPSIKLMIAKYNQKLSEQPSPEVRTTSSSPAWRSPVAERRDSGMVKAQMEKYQEEVRRALQDGFSSSRFGNSVQKSASAGALRFPSATKIAQKPQPLLKSSSAGAIKSPLLHIKKIEVVPKPPPLLILSNDKLDDTPSSPLDQSIDFTIQTYRKNPASPRHHSSKTPHSPCLRALKIKRAKEEFLSRGPGSISAEAGCRLSQVSAGSGSSFEDLLINNNEGVMKSASAGMINIHPSVYKRLTEPQKQDLTSKSTFDIKPESKSNSKFGLSSLASKLRKVRLRKKDRLNTVSLLCRQSLLVDLNDSNLNQSAQASTSTLGPSTSVATGVGGGGKESVSCPNSPVLLHKTAWTKKKPK